MELNFRVLAPTTIYKTHISIIESDNIFSNMLEIFLTGETYRQQRSNTDRAAYGGGGQVGEKKGSENGNMLLF